jgi:hypothetical protein
MFLSPTSKHFYLLTFHNSLKFYCSLILGPSISILSSCLYKKSSLWWCVQPHSHERTAFPHLYIPFPPPLPPKSRLRIRLAGAGGVGDHEWGGGRWGGGECSLQHTTTTIAVGLTPNFTGIIWRQCLTLSTATYSGELEI